MVTGAALVVATTSVVAATVLSSGEEGPKTPGEAPEVAAHSPLADYLGFGHDPVADERQVDRDTAERERFVADCMAEAGFRHPPPEAAHLEGGEEARYWRTLHGFPHDREGFTAGEVAELDEDGDGDLTFDEMSGDACIGQAGRAVPGVYAAAELIGDDADRLQDEVRNLIESSGATARLVSCVAETGARYASNAVVVRLALDDELQAPPEVQRCVNDYRTEVAAIRVEPETRFFAEHGDVIREYGLPAATRGAPPRSPRPPVGEQLSSR